MSKLQNPLKKETRAREFSPYKYIKDNYPKYILSLDDDWDYYVTA